MATKMATKNGGKIIFGKTHQFTVQILRGVKKFTEIALSRTVVEINAVLHFTQKFNMAAKNGGKSNFDEDWQSTLRIPWGKNFC